MHSPELHSRAIFPTSYFPSVGYLTEFLKFEIVEIEIHESYPKQTMRNRCTILSANGLLHLSIPVIKVNGNNTKTGEIGIFNNEPWQSKHLRAIESAYRSSPFFDHYIHHFEKIFNRKYEKLIDLNTEILQLIFKRLKTDKTVTFTKNYEKKADDFFDFRQTFNCKNIETDSTYKPYNQVFSDRSAFQPNLSFLDLLFNEGPNALMYLQKKM